jgi:hypothetical protein
MHIELNLKNRECTRKIKPLRQGIYTLNKTFKTGNVHVELNF